MSGDYLSTATNAKSCECPGRGTVTPGCQIQESQGLQLVLVQIIIRTQQSAIVNVQLFQTNLFQYKGGLCTSHATWYGSQI